MVNNLIIDRVVTKLRTLPETLQQEVLQFTEQIGAAMQPVGTPGAALIQFAGTIPPADIALMQQAIASCETVDTDEW